MLKKRDEVDGCGGGFPGSDPFPANPHHLPLDLLKLVHLRIHQKRQSRLQAGDAQLSPNSARPERSSRLTNLIRGEQSDTTWRRLDLS
jgi:hypothetical protein